MASFDSLFSEWGTTVLVGVGVSLAAPVLLPVVGAVMRPIAKEFIKGGLYITDAVQGVMAEGSERFSDLVAEVKTERAVVVNVTEGS